MGWDDLSKNEMRWPSIQEVHAYRQQVYRTVRHAIETHPGLAPGHPPITQNHPLWALFMGFEHERIHLETSSVLIHELPLALVQRPEEWPKLHPSAGRAAENFPPRLGREFPANDLIGVPGQPVALGKPDDWPSFGWDNEYGRRETTVQPFQASRHLVSNGEFHAFVVDGGYRERRYWSDTGWEWRTFRNIKWPTFWVPEGPAGLNRFRLHALFEVIDRLWDWPVEVHYHEARAYCARCAEQAGAPYRLPSEAEHQALRATAQRQASTLGVASDPVMNFDGAILIREQGWNLNLACGSSSPVDASRPTEAGFHDLFGNVWQWLEDHFNPLPGARIHPYYDDFSTPCYDGQHQMILGGFWVSTGDGANLWARFHFRPHLFQHAGFRLVPSAGDGGAVRLDQAGTSGQVYEDPQVLNEYLLLHYGAAEEQVHRGARDFVAAGSQRVSARPAPRVAVTGSTLRHPGCPRNGEEPGMWKKPRASGVAWIVVLSLTTGCSGGRPPSDLGVTEGRLAPCPGSPNCVSSQAVAEQRVEPLRYDGDAARARTRLLEVLNGMERARVVQSTDDYIYVEFRSAVFGFVDDVEFYFSPPGIVQVRSASRTGYYDFGVNRERVETLRAQFSTASNASGTTAR